MQVLIYSNPFKIISGPPNICKVYQFSTSTLMAVSFDVLQGKIEKMKEIPPPPQKDFFCFKFSTFFILSPFLLC